MSGRGSKRHKTWPRWLKRLLRAAGGLAVAFIIFFIAMTALYYHKHAGERYTFGVSFSDKYARELSLDPKQALTALTDDLGVRRFRLMSYWDEIEQSRGQFDFSSVDWQFDQVSKVGGTVSLAIGLRQPRWPECHAPAWFDSLDKAGREQALMDFLQATVSHFKQNRALVSYQLENEALNAYFGVCAKYGYDRGRLGREYELVKRTDPNHPVAISVSNESGEPWRYPRGDLVGFSVYRHVYDVNWTHRYWDYYYPYFWHAFRAGVTEFILRRPVFTHEQQAEPWGPAANKDLSIAEQDKSMSLGRLQETVRYAKDTGIRTVDLWGGEWWYWRKVHYNDPSLWDYMKTVFQQPQY